MSDERWNSGTPENEFTGSGSQADDENIVDGTAEVINESVDTEAASAKEYEQASEPTGTYESYSAGSSEIITAPQWGAVPAAVPAEEENAFSQWSSRSFSAHVSEQDSGAYTVISEMRVQRPALRSQSPRRTRIPL